MPTLNINIKDSPKGTYTQVKESLQDTDWEYHKPVFSIHNLTQSELASVTADIESIEGVKITLEAEEELDIEEDLEREAGKSVGASDAAPASGKKKVTVYFTAEGGESKTQEFELTEEENELSAEEAAKAYFARPHRKGGVDGRVDQAIAEGDFGFGVWPPESE